MKSQAIVVLSVLLFASCNQDATTQPVDKSPRQFSPRLVAVPPASIVLVEISSQPFGTVGGNGILAQNEADWNQKSIQIHNLPQGTLWFRVSGLGSDRSREWSSTGNVPSMGTSVVDIGGTSGVPITTAPAVSITATTNGNRLQLFCSSSSGSSHHPVWTEGNSSPAPGTSYQSTSNQTVEVELPVNSKITSRCTDGTTWGAISSWEWETIPNVPEPDLSVAGNELEQLDISVPPMGTTGRVSFSVKNMRTDIPNPQIALRTGGSAAFQRFPLAYSFEVSTATKVEAYLIGWSAVSHRWFKGPIQTTISGTPLLKGPGTSFGPPGIQGPIQTGGTIFFSPPSAIGNYQNIHLAVWNSIRQTTTLEDPNYSVVDSAPMTVKAYAIGWNPTAGDWFYGRESILTVPVQSSMNPVATAPSNEVAQPTVSLPPTGTGSMSFGLPNGSTTDRSLVRVVVKNSLGEWVIHDLSYQLPVSPGSTVESYLIEWSPTERRWKQGQVLVSNISSFEPPTPPILYMGGGSFGSPNILADGSFPVIASFESPMDIPAVYTPRKIAYRTSAIGAMATGAFGYIQEGTTVRIDDQLQLEAFVVAWDASSSTWKSGQSRTVNVFGGKPFGSPSLTIAGGTAFSEPGVILPVVLPGYLQFSFPTTLPTNLVDAKVAYQLGSTGVWLYATPGEQIPIQSPVQLVACIVAWSPSNQQWMVGNAKNVYLNPYGTTTLTAPGFADLANNPIATSLEVMGTSFTINMNATTGSILYTTDGSTPAPGTTYTRTWNSGNIMDIPAGMDSIVVRAVAYDGTRMSPENKITVHLPRWRPLDTRDLGCLVQGAAGKVFACGDGTGPKMLADTGWVDLVRDWNLSAAQTLYANDSELVAGVEGVVWRIRKFATVAERVGTTDLGWVYSLTRHLGDLVASTDMGTLYYSSYAWKAMPTLTVLDGTGPLWSDGTGLWQGSGEVVAKFGWDARIPAYNWMDWGTKASNIRAFAVDSFSTTLPTLREDMVVATESGIYQWNTSTPSLIGRSLVQSDVVGIEGIAWGPQKRLYMAFTNGSGQGGVRRCFGWAGTWNPVASGWPGQPTGNPVGAHGVGIHRQNDGTQRVVATTEWGSYTVNIGN